MRAQRGLGEATRQTTSGPTARAPASRDVLADQVRRLQSAAGNRAIARMVAPGRRTLARFGEPEHKAIGDKALADRRWRLPGSTLFKELELTFGDWVALGDWFEDIGELKQTLRGGPGEDTVGQVYYALLVRIRPTSEAERKEVEKRYMDLLFTKRDKEAVDKRYAELKTRNIKHFPNPLAGDTKLTTAQKATRRKDGKPFGAIAQYHADHLEAVALATSAGQLGDERLLGEALAMDGFACHFLTDAFSASHTRAPRASIETYWDKKVPDFDTRLVNWLADEIGLVIRTDPSGFMEFVGAATEWPLGKVRAKAREKIRKVVPALSFGDVVGLVVHDWEGAHGADRRGPLVEIAGNRLRTVGDEALQPAVAALEKVNTESQLKAVLKDRRRSAAERTFAGATLAVKASIRDVDRAYELGRKRRKKSDVIRALTSKSGLFASEAYLPNAVPEDQLSKDDRMPKWDFATVDQLLADPKIKEALPESARKVAEPFESSMGELDARKAIKDQLRRAVVKPLTSGDVRIITAWVKSVIDYSPDRLGARLEEAHRRHIKTRPPEDVWRIKEGVH